MLNKLSGIEERYQEISQELMQVGDDYQRAAELGKERSDLEPLYQKTQDYRQALEELEEVKPLLEAEDEEMQMLAQAEVDELEQGGYAKTFAKLKQGPVIFSRLNSSTG